MAFEVEVFDEALYPETAARRIAEALPGGGSLVITGGTTAEKIYPYLAGKKKDWSSVEIAFSDERVVPPDHAESNYGMAKRLFLDAAEPGHVHRVPGELDAERAAARYESDIRPLVERAFDVEVLGMGADAHIGAIFPGSPALTTIRLAYAVDRPDGMKGVTLAPPALTTARKIFLVVTGAKKAEAVARVVNGAEGPEDCPARLLADHPDATFLLDPEAAARL